MGTDEADPSSDPSLVMELGSRIAAAAEIAGGKRALAHAAGLKENRIHRYIRGENVPSVLAVAAIAQASGVGLEWLATGEGLMRPEGPRPPTAEEILAAASRELGRPVSVKEFPREEIVAWVRQWWEHADAKERAWLEVELGRQFPEFLEWKKKQEKDGAETEKSTA